MTRDEIMAEGKRLADRCLASTKPAFWVAAARQAVDGEAAVVAAWDRRMDGLSAKERAAAGRQRYGRKWRRKERQINGLRSKLTYRDEYVAAKAFELCAAMNAI